MCTFLRCTQPSGSGTTVYRCALSQQPLYSSFPADDLILFLQLAGQEDGQVENKYELSLMTSLML